MLNIPKATSDYQATSDYSDYRTPATIATIATMKSPQGLATMRYIFIIADENIIKLNT